MTKPIVYKIDEMPREAILDGGLTRTALRSDNALVTFNWFDPSVHQPPPHTHPFDQLSLVMTGTLIFTVDGEEVVAGPGTALRIPAGVPNTARPASADVALNIDIFAPARADYVFLAKHQIDFLPDI